MRRKPPKHPLPTPKSREFRFRDPAVPRKPDFIATKGRVIMSVWENCYADGTPKWSFTVGTYHKSQSGEFIPRSGKTLVEYYDRKTSELMDLGELIHIVSQWIETRRQLVAQENRKRVPDVS